MISQSMSSSSLSEMGRSSSAVVSGLACGVTLRQSGCSIEEASVEVDSAAAPATGCGTNTPSLENARSRSCSVSFGLFEAGLSIDSSASTGLFCIGFGAGPASLLVGSVSAASRDDKDVEW